MLDFEGKEGKGSLLDFARHWRENLDSLFAPLTHIDANTLRIYNYSMEYTWSETKRAANLRAHGLDFVDAPLVFDSVTFTFEDDRYS